MEGLGSRIPNLKHSTLSNISLEKTLLTKNKSHNRVFNSFNNNNFHNSNKSIFSYYKVKNSFLRPDVNKTFNIIKKVQNNFTFNNDNNNFINKNNIFLNNINEINPFNSPRINTYSNPNRNNINYIYKELKEDEEVVKKIKEKKKFYNKLKPNNNKNFLIKEYIKCVSPFKNISDNFYEYQNGFKSNKKNQKNLFNKTIGKNWNRNNLNIIYKNNNMNLILNSNNFENGFFDSNNINKRNIINKRFPKDEIEKFSNGFLTSSYVKK